MTKREAYREGRERGEECARLCKPGKEAREQAGCQCRGETDLSVSIEECRECIFTEALAAEENARQFSPFEFLAHDMNETGDRAEGLWEAFEQGLAVGARAGARERTRKPASGGRI